MNKKIFTILVPMAIGILLTVALFLPKQAGAQSPEKISYQAVIRDASGNLIIEQEVGMQISILHGSASGTEVYTETQTPTTNANGLVTLEIGTGVTTDNFTAIDWTNGPYFIKTETDPAGGTSYTISGTSQLLSVPYAFHAKTAETVTGEISETDPLYTSSQAVNITVTDITNLSNLSGTNTGDQDISGIATNTQAIQDTAAQIRSDISDVSGFLTNETDPVFAAWDKSSGISIIETQISNLGEYIETESDPVYNASVASGVTATDTASWNNKLTSETDPVYTGSQAAYIIATDIANLSNLSGINTGDQDISGIATNTQAIQDTAAQIRDDIPDVSGFLTSETDPVFAAWDKDYNDLINLPATITTDQANAITANSGKDTTGIYHVNRSALDLVSGTNTGDQDISGIATNTQAIQDTASQIRADIPSVADGSETRISAGTNVTITGSGTTASPYIVNASGGDDSPNDFYLGQDTLGGIVFYIYLDQDGNQHGLIVSKTETTAQWQSTTSTTNATSNWNGYYNTGLMSNSPAKNWVTSNFTSDWYLPSIDELIILWNNRFHINKAMENGGYTLLSSLDSYWSSSEYDATSAFYFLFKYAYAVYTNKTVSFKIRAVRAF